MIKAYQFYDLLRKINKELRLDNAVNIQNFASSDYYQSVFLGAKDAVGLYGKIKNSSAMKYFERTYKACLVLVKCRGSFVLIINY